MLSRVKLTSAVDTLMRAATAAASQPAWPPPTTMMSNIRFMAQPIAQAGLQVKIYRCLPLFHVEQSLADTEFSEQAVEHILGARLAGDLVERLAGHAKMFGDNQIIRLVDNRRQNIPGGG